MSPGRCEDPGAWRCRCRPRQTGANWWQWEQQRCHQQRCHQRRCHHQQCHQQRCHRDPQRGSAVAAGAAASVRAAPLKCQPNLGIFEDFFIPSPTRSSSVRGRSWGLGGGRERPPDFGCWAWGGCAAPPARRCRPLPKSSQPGIILLWRYITADKREEKHPKRARGATATAQNRWHRLVLAWGH